MKKSNPSDMWEDMNNYTDKYIEVLKDNEDEEGEKIHDDHTGPDVPKFVGKYTHGIQEHENELVSDTRNLRDQEKREAKRNKGKDDPDSVLRRVDQYAKKEMAVIDRNEKKQKNRIHADHNSKGTPPSIHDQNHEYDDHTKKMKNEIREVQKEEREDIQRKLGKSRSELTLLDIYDNSELFKSKKKKKKWPSFDVQSHQIAKREGVSEKDADAMLASRGRNHGTRKSLSEMSLAEIYKAADGRRRPEILSKVFDPSMLSAAVSAAADWLPNDPDDLENLQNAKHAVYHHVLLPVSGALKRKKAAVDEHNRWQRIGSHQNRRPLTETGTSGLDFAQGAVDTAEKVFRPHSISGPLMGGINRGITNVRRGITNVRQRIGL